MTHACNYGFKERLAIHLFTNVTNFIEKWTNIKLLSDKPVELAKRYFDLFPRHAEPLWTVSFIQIYMYMCIYNRVLKFLKLLIFSKMI